MSSPVKEIFPVEDDQKKAAAALLILAKQNGQINIEVTNVIREAILSILEKIANEEAVAILSVSREYSTNEASEILRVSRPFVTKLLNQGEIPFRQVGSHRRIEAKDLLAYKAQKDREKNEAFDRMANLTQEIEND